MMMEKEGRNGSFAPARQHAGGDSVNGNEAFLPSFEGSVDEDGTFRHGEA